MNLDFAALAEAAAIGATGDRLYIHGAPLRQVDVPQLPWASSLDVALSFTAPLDEAGASHELGFMFVGPQEDRLILTGTPLAVALPRPEALAPGQTLIGAIATIQIGLVTFSHAGPHSFKLFLDGNPLTTLELVVVVQPHLRDRLLALEVPPPPDA